MTEDGPHRPDPITGTITMIMLGSLDRCTTAVGEAILCYYANSTRQTLTLHLESPQGEPRRRLLFPQERLFFTADSDTLLKVYRHEREGLALIEAIACQHLQVHQSPAGDEVSCP